MKTIKRTDPVAIVLGGTLPHKAIIENLKKRGYYTVLVDFLKNPIAKCSADIHMQESTLDLETVYSIAKDYHADCVICSFIDQANVTACYVAEKLGLHAPYSYNTSLITTDKVLMKKLFIENNIPTSRHYIINEIKKDCLDLDLNYPLIIKPNDSNSSKGVYKINNSSNLYSSINKSLEFSRTKKVIVEEFIEGIEIGIDCIVNNGVAKVILVKERRKIKKVENKSQQIYGCFWPAEFKKNILEKINKIANSIATAFNLYNSPLMIQAIVKDEEVFVIEFGARFGGGESFRIIELSTGFKIIDAAINYFTGESININFSKPQKYYAENFLYATEGKFGQIKGFENLISNKTIVYGDNYKNKGASIGNELSSNNRVGVFTVEGESKEDLLKKISDVIKRIEIKDTEGNNIFKSNIYNE